MALILDRIVDRIEQIGGFPAARLVPPGRREGPRRRRRGPPFFQAQTGHEWVVTLRFTVRRNAFKKPETLAGSSAWPPSTRASPPVLSDAERISHRRAPKGRSRRSS